MARSPERSSAIHRKDRVRKLLARRPLLHLLEIVLGDQVHIDRDHTHIGRVLVGKRDEAVFIGDRSWAAVAGENDHDNLLRRQVIERMPLSIDTGKVLPTGAASPMLRTSLNSPACEIPNRRGHRSRSK